jgi:hypothetical protein
MATDVQARAHLSAPSTASIAPAAYAAGAALLAVEGGVHVQQYGATFHAVSWVGPLFLANAAACLAVIAGLAYSRTREIAALGGIVVSAIALGSLVVSYGQGIFGWQEVGFRTPIALAMVSEAAAVVLLAAGLTARAMVRGR